MTPPTPAAATFVGDSLKYFIAAALDPRIPGSDSARDPNTQLNNSMNVSNHLALAETYDEFLQL